MEEASGKMARYFGAIIENRDYITTQHARRVGMITYVLLLKLKALYLNYNLTDQDVKMISSAATLHDVGKLCLPDKIINKASRLTDEEYEKRLDELQKNVPEGITLDFIKGDIADRKVRRHRAGHRVAH